MNTRQLISMLPIILIVVLMYFLMIRPQRKKQKQTETMRKGIKPGDKIVTIGGLKGKVVKTFDDALTIEVGSGTSKARFEVMRWAISSVGDQQGGAGAGAGATAKKEEEEPAPKKKPKKLGKDSDEEKY
jgi:preprotein translocase YajC subunit